MPEIFNRESKLLLLLLIFKYFGPLIEAFRGDKQGAIEAFRESASSVIPEIFYRESKFLLFLWFLNAFGPLIEAFRGDKQG